jgi:ORF6N domain
MQIELYKAVEAKILEIRNHKVIIDSDVAELYGVETKRINEAVNRNDDKFPEGYVLELTSTEWEGVKSQFATSPNPLGGGKLRAPKAFTEPGLYMLATILKSDKATETTLAIIDTFTKVREIGRVIKELPDLNEASPKYKKIAQKTGELIADLIIPEDLATTETEASIEVDLALVKFKYSVKKQSKDIKADK